ncbi:hypothetical protein RB623_20560 [Mesorhizobium sp. LHD-90]|uniref:hypothetical protein n=1 Tax=Mesorhizobium sp. LHD-90 TaxID=3071414 RepID=UPI0027E1CA4C|nr:hypothetical protein [Mesorhizobium sp. LHD-90]MDQ6436449.1 hypothetical protein [Mesorhizobium sp. LHD-90]
MSIESEPKPHAPWPPLASNDTLYRYPKPYPLNKGGKKDNLAGIAKDHSLEASDLLTYNFLTTESKKINWYLAHVIGCTVLSPGRGSYTFEGVVHDAKTNRGVVFIPSFGDSTKDYANRIGERMVENYNLSKNKEPGGKCHRTCYARVEEASRQTGGPALPKVNWEDKKSLTDPFVILWSSYIGVGKAWFDLPEKYRGKGAAGAIAYKGWGTLVEGVDIWAGKLKPGAVIQAWGDAADYPRVRDGKASESGGHSFIFLHYVKSGTTITGMVIADQGYQNGSPLKKGDYGYWVGANIVAPAPAKP